MLRESADPAARPPVPAQAGHARRRTVDLLHVEIHPDPVAAGRAAAAVIADELRAVLRDKEVARVVFAAAPSQDATLDALAAAPDLDWSRVVAFQMDEYRGVAPGDPASFAGYLRRRLFDRVRPGRILILDGTASAAQELARYADLLLDAPLDIVCLGIGENGHIAFNDPDVADFADPEVVKLVTLDDRSRRQQVSDGCFASLAEVPREAFTLTVPTLLSAAVLVGSVPGAAKAEAVAATLDGPVRQAVPATALRSHPRCTLFVDAAAAAGLTGAPPLG
ncbi:6-phosphogluconolactonase [Dactylosporangium salmoneum]|uniref:Glucosamine-6-phosphate deaminase n=1 Tax=Dactylosporangium salmoneum TaxID=53361 RepID=A0ABN3HUC3_9ACTN